MSMSLLILIMFNVPQDGETALHVSCGANHLEVVEVFLNNKNIDINAKNKVSNVIDGWL
jgi:ankyrin repeat protein